MLTLNMPQVNYMGCLVDGEKHFFSYQVNRDSLKCHCFSQSRANKIKAALLKNGYNVITTNYGWYLKL